MISLICGILQSGTNELIYENRSRFTDLENKFIVTKEEKWGGRDKLEFGIKIYTLLYIK